MSNQHKSRHSCVSVGWFVNFFERWIDETPEDSKYGRCIRRICSNRWIRTTTYGLVTVTCCAVYFGWQQFQKILFQGGAYAWLCTNPGWQYKIEGACSAQNAKVQMLYTVASAMEYVVGVIAGVLLDHLGPRFTGLIGLFILLLGLLLLSQSFQVYTPSMILLGKAVNLIAYPALLAGDFFPRHQAMAISLIVSCQVGCGIVSVILLEIWRLYPSLLFNHLFIGYLCCVWTPACLLYFFFLPCRRRVIQFDPSSTSEPESTAATAITDEMTEIGDYEQETTNGILKRRIKVDNAQQLQDKREIKTILMKGNWGIFFSELLSWDVEIFTAYYVAQLLQFVYYPTTTLRMFGMAVSDFAGYIMPSQILWGIIFGCFVDHVGTLPLCYAMNTVNVIVFSFMLIGDSNLQYATAILNCIAQSFIYTSKFTYVTEMYSPHNFGKLTGFIGFMGGIFAFANIPISASSDYRFWSIFFLGISGFCYIALTILIIRQRKGFNYLKSIDLSRTSSKSFPSFEK